MADPTSTQVCGRNADHDYIRANQVGSNPEFTTLSMSNVSTAADSNSSPEILRKADGPDILPESLGRPLQPEHGVKTGEDDTFLGSSDQNKEPTHDPNEEVLDRIY